MSCADKVDGCSKDEVVGIVEIEDVRGRAGSSNVVIESQMSGTTLAANSESMAAWIVVGDTESRRV